MFGKIPILFNKEFPFKALFTQVLNVASQTFTSLAICWTIEGEIVWSKCLQCQQYLATANHFLSSFTIFWSNLYEQRVSLSLWDLFLNLLFLGWGGVRQQCSTGIDNLFSHWGGRELSFGARVVWVGFWGEIWPKFFFFSLAKESWVFFLLGFHSSVWWNVITL